MKLFVFIVFLIWMAGCTSPQAPVVQPTNIAGLSIPDTIDFGVVRVGIAKDSNIIFKNTGTDTIQIVSQHISNSVFKLSNPPQSKMSIAPGASQTVTIQYIPSDTSTVLAYDTIRTANKTNILVLRGEATPFISHAKLSIPDTIDFGAVRAGLSKTLSVRFQNTGSDSLHITSQIISDSFFQEDSYWKQFNIAPDSSRIANITYFPHNPIDIAFDTLRSGSGMNIITLLGKEVPFSSGLPSAPKEITITLTGVIGSSYGSPNTFSFYYDEPSDLSQNQDSVYFFTGSTSGGDYDTVRSDQLTWWSGVTDISATIDTSWVIKLLTVEYNYSYSDRDGGEDCTKAEVLKLHNIVLDLP